MGEKTYQEKAEGLDTLRRKALKDGDYIAYAILNDRLGFEPERMDAHCEGLASRKSSAENSKRATDLENSIDEQLYGKDYAKQQTKTSKPPNIIREKDYKNFGITQEMFNKLPYRTVRSVFFGVHNFDCPELYKYMNPTEMLGLWAGIGKKEKTFRTSINPDSVVDTLSALVSAGYEQSVESQKRDDEVNLGYQSQHANKHIDKYSTASGDLKERLSTIDDKVMQKISEQLSLPKRYTEEEKNICRGEPGFDEFKLIYDPNSDSPGISKEAKRAYATIIVNKIANTYQSYIRENTTNSEQ
jgi:hypothetical protein